MNILWNLVFIGNKKTFVDYVELITSLFDVHSRNKTCMYIETVPFNIPFNKKTLKKYNLFWVQMVTTFRWN